MNAESSSDLGTPRTGKLCITDGRRLDEPAPCTLVESAPTRAARARKDDRLFLLTHLDGPATRQLASEILAVASRTYWEATGSITAALRRAVSAANRHLFQANLTAAERCTGGLVCAVASGESLFVVQAGPSVVYHLRRGRLERLTDDDTLPLGSSQVADVRLYHTLIERGDVVLLASSTPAAQAGDDGLARTLSLPGPEEALDGLAQIGSGSDLSALVLHWGDAGGRRGQKEPSPAAQVRPAAPLPRPNLRKSARVLKSGVASTGGRLAAGATSLLRHLLPSADRPHRPRTDSTPPSSAPPPTSPPSENRALLMPIALGIPVLLAVLVTLAYLTLGSQARYQSVVKQAQAEMSLAQAAGEDKEAARAHWARALEHAETAVALHPEDPAAIALRNQAQAALDALDGIVRLHPILLRAFGTGTLPRRLVVHGQMIFVLDPAGGWVAKMMLNGPGEGLVEDDRPILVQTGQRIGDGTVGRLVDCVWVKLGSGRHTSGLLVLEEGGALVDYDPSWEGEGGTPQLSRSFLQTPPVTPGPVDSFEGRLYVLDRALPQIRRYDPLGDVYSVPPSNYFAAPDLLPRPLSEALDMAIDGNIYLLYDDGTVLKFLGGEPQPFDSSGVPGGIGQAVALAVDPDGSGTVYIADRARQRVVALSPDGTFLRQFRAAEAFDALEALVVDESSKRLYTISDGRLFVATLP